MNTAARNGTIHRLLQSQAEQCPDAPFVFFEDQVFSYADVEASSGAVAAGLERRGIGKGDKVAIVMRSRPEFLYSWFGLNKLGAVEVPIHPEHKGEVLRHMLDISDTRIVIVQADYLEQILDVADRISQLERIIVLGEHAADNQWQGETEFFTEILAFGGAYTEAAVEWSDPFAIMFTSGTTGRSKGALLPHNYAVRSAEIFVERLAIVADDRYYQTMPLFHLGGQFAVVMPALLAGISIVLRERFSVQNFLPEVRQYGCTISNYAGGMLAMLASAEPRTDDRDNPLRMLNGSGAPAEIHRAFEERFGVQLMNEGYGMTEIGTPLLGTLGESRPGTCGTCHSDYAVKIVDDDGFEVGPNTPGELLVRPLKPYRMMLEYYNMPEQTVEAWRDLWFHTGDILMELDDGFFKFIDRKKDALRRRGENISSFEVEEAVNQHPSVLQSAVIGMQSELGEDEVMVCVTLNPGMELEPQQLLEHCRTRVARFMVPRYVRIMPDLPRTPTQRVQKHVLRDQGLTDDTWDKERTAYVGD